MGPEPIRPADPTCLTLDSLLLDPLVGYIILLPLLLFSCSRPIDVRASTTLPLVTST